MDILDDMGVSKLSAKVFSKVNNSFKHVKKRYCMSFCYFYCSFFAQSYFILHLISQRIFIDHPLDHVTDGKKSVYSKKRLKFYLHKHV